MKTKLISTLTALAAILLCACTTSAQVPPANSVEIKQRDAAGSAWLYPSLTPQPDSALTFGADRKPGTTALATFARASDLTLLSSSVGTLQSQVSTDTGAIATLQTQLAAIPPHANITTLNKISETDGHPLWNGAAWPGNFPLCGGDSGQVSLTTANDADLTIKAVGTLSINCDQTIRMHADNDVHISGDSLMDISSQNGTLKLFGDDMEIRSHNSLRFFGDYITVSAQSDLIFSGDHVGIHGSTVSIDNPGDGILNITADPSTDDSSITLQAGGSVNFSARAGNISITAPHVKVPDGTDADDAVSKRQLDNAVKDQNTGTVIKRWFGSQAQYDAISKKDTATEYNIY